MEEQRLILVIEDDEATQRFLVEDLAADGFRAVGASSAGEGLRAIEVRRPALVVLSARVAEADRVRSFARGADDPVCKPTRSLVSVL
jgi:DNA-binding response OmpR family regulator